MVMPNVVKIKFYNQKIAFCKNDKFNLKKNLIVIVKTDRGLQFGIVTDLEPKDIKIEDLEKNTIIRISTKQDYQRHLANKEDEKKALKKCKELSVKYNFRMISYKIII